LSPANHHYTTAPYSSITSVLRCSIALTTQCIWRSLSLCLGLKSVTQHLGSFNKRKLNFNELQTPWHRVLFGKFVVVQLVKIFSVGFEVFTAVVMKSIWFLLNLFRPWRWRRYVPPKRRVQLNWLHGVISQEMILFKIFSVYGHRRCITMDPWRSVTEHRKLNCFSSITDTSTRDENKLFSFVTVGPFKYFETVPFMAPYCSSSC
jgi:hypothetical protein